MLGCHNIFLSDLSMLCCTLQCRDPEQCDKNHLEFTKDCEGRHLTMVLAHFKNDTIKGTQHLHMADQMHNPFIYLEQAHNFLAPNSPTLWFNSYGETYSESYWSTICSKALTLHDGRRITAKVAAHVIIDCMSWSCNPTSQGCCLLLQDFRHLFATAWRDYINTPTTTLADLTMHQLDAAAADLMCSSTQAFTNSYDDTNRVRGNMVVLAKYKSFKTYVETRYKVKQTER